MPKITLQAGSTFWFDYPANPPARHVFEGQPFEIDSEHFAEYSLVGKELLAGQLPGPKKPLAEVVLNKVKTALGIHNGDPTKWPCQHCDRVFNAERGLEIHMRNAHRDLQVSDSSPEPVHQCPHCDRSFGSERGLQVHIGHIHENHQPEE